MEASLAANTVIDRESFLARVNLSNRASRNQANALLKRLGIKVAIRKAGSRSKLAHYAVYQHEKLIMKLRDESGTITSDPFSPDMAWRLYHQGQLKDHEMEISIGFESKKLPKSGESAQQVASRAENPNAPDWSQYDGPFPDNDYEDEYTPTGT